MYGPQPVANGLLTTTQLLTYTAATGAIAAALGIYLIAINGWDPVIWILLGLGAFFVLFYTWPLKYIALGEVAVLLVWGPLMIGGGYYVLAHQWDWNVVWASIPYYFGVTTVIFGKHIDKITVDKEKGIYTLPVLLGEKNSRIAVVGMMVAPYLLVLAMIALKYFTPVMLVVLLAFPTLRQVLPHFLKPRPVTRPDWFPDGQGGWPLFFAPLAFRNNRTFGGLFMLGLLVDVLLRIYAPAFWR
jgi:1,4-dihydroxy-2-naphthoate octaprenyltransferase